ncbi:uncharacterized protein LY89DRAFT_703192 [Mollisia scopiformis]|uniref:SWR1-complex protein 3 domain-containing protein n=1 Tax=Mollisia scopiformis TaxID=149040 RepID=A0A194XU94_MOLSC|nr:uncharacterized protein LY89DRAFT_703192 [Mollisia scopiformis]KUJ23890.1 hypothetical protein LY89DRAFT_703192 [Mollisia scopiformis]
MERKRKLPARAARVESASKKRSSTPPQQPAQTQIPTLPPTQPLVQEILPQSIAPGKPLPTIDSPQPENLPEDTFQTIAESGVLSESLHRSRQKWLSEGIFEKYWTKPTKRKGAPEAPPNNPPKESMTKLGPVTISADPHSFEATMFAVKAAPLQSAIHTSQQPMYRPIIQYGPPGGMMPPPPTPAPILQKPNPPPQPAPPVSPRNQDVQMANTNTPTGSITPVGAQPNSSALNGRPSSQSTSNPQVQSPINGHTTAPPPPPSGRSDPVIQMLAERAATDPDLKALMKTVANGEASPDQLRKFQAHIDELTRIQKLREAEAKPIQRPTQPPPPPPASAVPQTNGHSTARPMQTSPVAPKVAPTSISHPAKPEQPQPQALRSKGPVPSTKPDITNVVFEFAGGNGDRYQFPRHSILEYLPGGQVIASFLIVRKGSSADSPSYDPELDYYQPITIRLFAYQGRQLEALQKVVAPPEEVRRYMDDVMDNATRAEYVLLAMRLPKDKEQTPPVESIEEAEKGDQINHQITPWATTTSTPIPKAVKPPKKFVSEEEQYQAFINTVTPVL